MRSQKCVEIRRNGMQCRVLSGSCRSIWTKERSKLGVERFWIIQYMLCFCISALSLEKAFLILNIHLWDPCLSVEYEYRGGGRR